MSGGGDNFLARWSRRKREVEEAEPQHPQFSPTPDPTPGASPPGSAVPALGVNMPMSETPDFGRGGEPAEGTEPLPSLADMTAESDLSAFLREGIPDALKQAALRRMWSLDPAIRDHVGLAEYAWDFNNPASIPGFGTVAAGTPMAQLAAKVMSVGKEADAANAAMGDAPRTAPAEVSPAALPSSISRPGPPMGAPAPEAPGDSSRGGGSEVRDDGPAETENRPVPRHGGAMPR